MDRQLGSITFSGDGWRSWLVSSGFCVFLKWNLFAMFFVNFALATSIPQHIDVQKQASQKDQCLRKPHSEYLIL
jgi:hypothetical protein